MRPLPALLFLIVMPAAVPAAEWRVVGSDFLRGPPAEAIQTAARRDGSRVALALDGTRPGLTELRSGRAHVGLLLLPPGEEPPAGRLFLWPVAHVAVAVVVNEAVPLIRITGPQLRAVFGDGPAVRWGDLGVAGEWRERPVVLLVPAQEAGPTAAFFRGLVLQSAPFGSGVRGFAAGAGLLAELRANSHALAVVPASLLPAAGVKAVAVTGPAGGTAILPTPANIESGAYPYRVPLSVAFRREAVPRTRELLRFLHSDEFAAAVEAAGFVPLGGPERSRRLFDLESLR